MPSEFDKYLDNLPPEQREALDNSTKEATSKLDDIPQMDARDAETPQVSNVSSVNDTKSSNQPELDEKTADKIESIQESKGNNHETKDTGTSDLSADDKDKAAEIGQDLKSQDTKLENAMDKEVEGKNKTPEKSAEPVKEQQAPDLEER